MSKTDKQQDIFNAALKLFARYGFKKTTVADVAAEVGMTKSNLYFYVANKRDLYEHTVRNALIQWRDSVAAAIFQVDDVVEKFTVMATKSFEYLSNHAELRSILIMDPGIFTLSPAEDRFFEINQGAMLLIKDILRQGIEEGNSAFRMYEEGVALIVRGLCRKGL